ncbi:keratin 98 [Chanos chanos]|uniref:Keratin 98 n=1 Tax=Chanos chanos TaxID=29144 RepID=A0A6J2V4K8_CHACN|nr:keratin, type I cytoskeletal 13-like [Chanos chanos]
MSFLTRSYANRALSVYGGAGGSGSRISPSVSSTMYSPGGFNLADGLDLHVSANEKATMQNLNDRLASYLERVRTLEKANADLEKKIREWYESRTVVAHDHSPFMDTIEDLRRQIFLACRQNAKTLLDIDNAKLAAEDFKMKSENEKTMRLAVEADIAHLRRTLDDMSMARSDLEMQYEGLKEELIFLKKNHEEEMALQRTQLGGQVNVTVDAAPSADLNQTLKEIREHYESVTAKNKNDLELWYQSKISTVEQEVITQNEDLLEARTELKQLKSTLQSLQIDLQALHSMKLSLEDTLAETQERYAIQLADLQNTVTSLETQLSQIHANIASNKADYDQLLDLKTRLEMEIAEYRRLLDGDDSSSSTVVKKVITVVETIVDGKVVETSKTVDIDVQSDNDD